MTGGWKDGHDTLKLHLCVCGGGGYNNILPSYIQVVHNRTVYSHLAILLPV